MIGENLCCCFMSQFPQSILDEESIKVSEQITQHAD
jgi:sirohydrochlorin cobaltochelatase